MTDVRVSVVVGANEARATLRPCLESLQSQLDHVSAEVIVATSERDTALVVRARFPGLRLVFSETAEWVNELWSEGIRQCRGDIVALTTAQCLPAPDWLERVVAAHAGPHAAVGGVIEKAEPSGRVDWAIYFCRYAAHMPPLPRAEVPEIAGDNASYKREVLQRYPELLASGFWEPLIHARIRADSLGIVRDPAIVVSYATGLGLRGFLRQRFHHGRIFARLRKASMRFPAPQVRALSAPLVPFLMAVRIARHAGRSRRLFPPFLSSLPFTMIFLASWALGEMVGYLAPRTARRDTLPRTTQSVEHPS